MKLWKQNVRKYFLGPSKVLKSISWPIKRPFGMGHLLCACVFVPFRFYTTLLPKAEAKTIDFSDKLSVRFNNKPRKPSKKYEKQMINHVHTYQEKRYFWFQAFTWLVLSCWRSWSWPTWLKLRFLWNMSR